MRRYFPLSGLLLLLLAAATPASALPAPMSDADLLAQERSRGARARAVGHLHRDHPGRFLQARTLPSYSAKVELIEVIKGDVAKGDDVTITFHEIPKGLLGPWSVFYYPGEMVWTHLVKDGKDYTTTWWNGRGEVVHKAVITTLPTKPGESVAIKRLPRRASLSRLGGGAVVANRAAGSPLPPCGGGKRCLAAQRRHGIAGGGSFDPRRSFAAYPPPRAEDGARAPPQGGSKKELPRRR